MKVQQILQAKGSEVHAIGPDATMGDVAQTLVRHNCGSLLVRDGQRVVGIVTERDILRACASDSRPLCDIRVEEKMSTHLVTAAPDDKVDDVMGLLTEKRIRHLPILRGDDLVGIISIGDVVKAQHDRLSLENHYLKSYIHS